jgi:uncharacterized protein (TIGR02271 family)
LPQDSYPPIVSRTSPENPITFELFHNVLRYGFDGAMQKTAFDMFVSVNVTGLDSKARSSSRPKAQTAVRSEAASQRLAHSTEAPGAGATRREIDAGSDASSGTPLASFHCRPPLRRLKDHVVKATPDIRNGSAAPTAAVESSARDDQTVIPVMREELHVNKRRVETDSGVRIVKKVEEREALVDEPLAKDHVDVQRLAINRPIDAPLPIRYEGDTMVVPVFEEVLVVEKRLILKEEIRITRRRSEFRDPQHVTLREEVAAVERIEQTSSSASPQAQGSSRVASDSAETLLQQRRREQDALRRTLDTTPSRD